MREDIRALIARYPPRDPNVLLPATSLPLAATSFGAEDELWAYRRKLPSIRECLEE